MATPNVAAGLVIDPKTGLPASSSNPVATAGSVVDGPPAPYTPAQVSAASTATAPAATSPFSSSAMGGNAGSTGAAVTTAAAALSGQAPPTPNSVAVTVPGQGAAPATTISITPNKQYQYQLPNGQMISVSDPTINTAALAGAKFIMGPTGSEGDPLIGNAGFAQSAPGGAGVIPQGYTASTPNAQGQITYTNPTTNTTFTLASGVDPSKVAATLSNVNTNVAANLGSGYSTQVQPDGSFNITDPTGAVVGNIPVAAASDPTTALPAYVTAITTKASATTAANSVMTADLATLDASHKATIDQLNREMDAAIGEAGAGSGGYGKAGESGAQQRVQTLIDEENASYAASQATIRSQNQTAIAAAASDYEKNTTSVLQTAQSVATQESQFAQSSFLNTAKAFDVSTAQFAPGTSLQTLTIGANGTTGNATVDAAIKNGVAAGYTPQGALGLLQAGVATQNKANQAQFLGLLQQASYNNGWATATPAQLAADPVFNAYVGMAQSYIPNLTPEAAAALVSGGTIQQQKLAIAQTGSPTGAALVGQGGGAIGTVAEGTTNDPTFVIPGTQGLYTQADIDKFAAEVNAGANVATQLGSSMGGGAAKQRILAAINNRATQLNPDGLAVIKNQQMLKGLQVSTNTASRLQSVTSASIQTMGYSFNLLLGDPKNPSVPGLIDQVKFGTDVVYNKATGYYVSNLGAGATNAKQATVAKYLQALNTITNEYGRVLYGGTSGAATDSSREDAAGAINGYLSQYSMTQVLNQVQGEVDARQTAYQSVIDGNASAILGSTTYDDAGNPIMGAAPDPTATSSATTGTTDSASGFGWNGQ